jgi:diamine N-acetyltransferase
MTRSGPTGRDGGREAEGEVRLEPVGADNRKAILALELADDQVDHVASNAESLAEARRDKDARPRAVMAGDRAVGFLMYDASNKRQALLYRFMIDRREQRRGYGRAALAALVREVEALAHTRDIVVCYMPDNDGARRLYRTFCFVEEGEDEDGEIIARLSLAKRRSP